MKRRHRIPGCFDCLCRDCIDGILGPTVSPQFDYRVAPFFGDLPWRLP